MFINRTLCVFAATAALLLPATASHAATLNASPGSAPSCLYASNECYILPTDFEVKVEIDGGGATGFQFEFTFTGGGKALYFSTNQADDFTGEIRFGKVDQVAVPPNILVDLQLAGGGTLLVGDGPLILHMLEVGALYAITVTGSFNDSRLPSGNLDFSLNPVPIPPALLLFGSALVGLGYLARRRRASTGPGLPA